MNILIGIITISLLALFVLGFYFQLYPLKKHSNHTGILKKTIASNLLFFVSAQLGLLFFAFQDVMAAPQTEVIEIVDFSIGRGLAFIGIALPTCFATLGAGIAVAPIGASSLAAISEKPEIFGRSLIYLGLAEGIAIYGLVATILLLNKL